MLKRKKNKGESESESESNIFWLNEGKKEIEEK